MSTMKLLQAQAMANMLGVGYISNREMKKYQTYNCVQCEKEIPPGKPGRKCKKCWQR